jgi:hypothetical protein
VTTEGPRRGVFAWIAALVLLLAGALIVLAGLEKR